MSMGAAEKIPVVLVTGFLGSGKTAALNTLLRQPALADSAVVVNEFGEIGLDHLLVSTSKENVVLLDAGCLCCAVVDSLPETLIDLHHRRARAQLPAFKRVLIETTGLANPLPIIRAITRDPMLAHFYRLAAIVCMVDALHGERQLREHSEALEQAACADCIVITKSDLLTTPPADLIEQLRTINPHAEIVIASFGEIAADTFLGNTPADNQLPWPRRSGSADGALPMFVATSAVPATGELHDRAIRSESFLFDKRVTWSGVAAWIEVMRQVYGTSLLRCKGVLNIGGTPVLLHGVQSMFDTRRLSAWPDDERQSRLVVIGKNLSRAPLQDCLEWFCVDEGTQPPLHDLSIMRSSQSMGGPKRGVDHAL